MFFPLFITFHKVVHAHNCLLTLQFIPYLEIGLVCGGNMYKDDWFYDSHYFFPHALNTSQIYSRTNFYHFLWSTMSKNVKETAYNELYCCQDSVYMPLKATNATQNCCTRLLWGLKVPIVEVWGWLCSEHVDSRLFTTGLLSKTSQDASSQLA